jgi:hypothetical protein
VATPFWPFPPSLHLAPNSGLLPLWNAVQLLQLLPLLLSTGTLKLVNADNAWKLLAAPLCVGLPMFCLKVAQLLLQHKWRPPVTQLSPLPCRDKLALKGAVLDRIGITYYVINFGLGASLTGIQQKRTPANDAT